jgi:hypothetical protein
MVPPATLGTRYARELLSVSGTGLARRCRGIPKFCPSARCATELLVTIGKIQRRSEPGSEVAAGGEFLTRRRVVAGRHQAPALAEKCLGRRLVVLCLSPSTA